MGAAAAAVKRFRLFSTPDCKRRQRHEQQIGKTDPCEIDRKLELLVVSLEAGRDDIDDERHRHHCRCREQEEPGQQHGEHFDGKGPGLLVAVSLDALGKQRHEGIVEGTFRKKCAEEIGKALGDEESLRDGPGAERKGNQLVAQESRVRG